MTTIRKAPMVLLVAALALAACQDLPTGSTAPGAPGMQIGATGANGTARATVTAAIKGVVRAPAGYQAEGGDPFAAPARYLLAATDRPLANAEVFLADGAGNPLPNLPTATTDAEGRFEFKDAPPGFTYVVSAKARTGEGKPAVLQTLAAAGEEGTAEIDAASTLVTAAVVEGGGEGAGKIDQAKFKGARDQVRKKLEEGPPPDLSDRAAVRARAAELQGAIAEVRGLIEEVRKELQDARATIEALRKQLADRPPTAAARPAASGEPSRPEARPSGEPARPAPCAQAFREKDANGDGAVTLDELLAKAGAAPTDELRARFAKMDRNGDGKVEIGEACLEPAPATRPSGAPEPTRSSEPTRPAPSLIPGAEPTRPAESPRPAGSFVPIPCDELFKRKDKDADGFVTMEEQKENGVLTAAGEQFITSHDRDGDRRLTRDEACSPVATRTPEPVRPSATPSASPSAFATPNLAVCTETFKRRDASGDGKITREEFVKAWTDATDPNVRFDQRDANKDGVLTLEEMCTAPGTR